MRWVVDGCSPVFSLISLSETASSREASTSISANMRSMTWIVGVAGAPVSFFLMAIRGEMTPRFYHVKNSSAGISPLAVEQQLVRLEAGFVVHLGALADPVAQIDVRQLQAP